jgi:hypothetical protein
MAVCDIQVSNFSTNAVRTGLNPKPTCLNLFRKFIGTEVVVVVVL